MVLLVVAFIVVTLLGFSIGMAVTQSKPTATIEDLSTEVSNAEKTATSQAAAATAAAATIEALSTEVSNAKETVTSQAATGTAAAATIEALTTEVSNLRSAATDWARANASATAISEQSAFVLNDTISIAPEKYATIPGIELNGSFTIAAWVKRESKDKNFIAIWQGIPEPNTGLVFGYLANKFTCAFWGNDWSTTSTYTNTGWIHWACTVDANQKCGNEKPCRIIYKDGKVEDGQHSGTDHGEYQGSGKLSIGDAPSGAAPRHTETEGSVTGVAVYTRVLNEGEIRSLMKFTRPPGAPRN